MFKKNLMTIKTGDENAVILADDSVIGLGNGRIKSSLNRKRGLCIFVTSILNFISRYLLLFIIAKSNDESRIR